MANLKFGDKILIYSANNNIVIEKGIYRDTGDDLVLNCVVETDDGIKSVLRDHVFADTESRRYGLLVELRK